MTFKKSIALLVCAILCVAHYQASQIPDTHPNDSCPLVLTTTAIIEIYEGSAFQGIVLIECGKEPFGKCLAGGKVEYGETVEDAIRRETAKKIDLHLFNLRQFHVYSSFECDKQRLCVEITYLAHACSYPRAGEDVSKAFVYSLDNIPWDDISFDQAKILCDYIKWRSGDSSRAILLH